MNTKGTSKARMQQLLPMIFAKYGSKGVIPRGRLLTQMIQNINENTIALRPPRSVEQPLPVNRVWFEVQRDTETITVTNPDDAEDQIDVARATLSTFLADNGDRISLIFDNSLIDEG